MTPLTLSPGQVHQALAGKVTIARPMEPQPELMDGAWYWKHPNYDNGAGVDYFHTVNLEGIMEAWCEASPFGPVDSEFVVASYIPRLTLIHTGTEVKQEDGKWVWLSTFEEKE